MAICIDRCVCMKTPFAVLLPMARERGWDLAALMERTHCGDECGMCRPYLRAMLATGVTVFDHILNDDAEESA